MKKITLLLFIFTSFFSFGQVLSEDFEGLGGLPAGWTNNDIAASGEIWEFLSTGEAPLLAPGNTDLYTVAGMSGTYAIFNSDGYGAPPSPAEECALESPSFDCSGLTTVQLSFNNFFIAGYGGTGFVEVFDGTMWIEVASFTESPEIPANTFTADPVAIDVTPQLMGVTNAQVRFRWVGDWSYYWVVDDVVVEEGPSCFDPTDFVLGPGGVTATSFDIAWTDPNGMGSTFDIEWGLQNFTLGTGTMETGIATPNFNFMGLAPDTLYEFYITTNCGGMNGSSEQVGPILFETAFDCTTFGIPYTTGGFPSENAYNSCFSVEDGNMDALGWTLNFDVNDLDGDGTNENFLNIFPQAANVAKDDWVFSPALTMMNGQQYTVTVVYNGVDIQAAANESFDLVMTDAPNAAAGFQSVIGSYSGITQAGVFGDMGGNDLITQAYTSSETFTAPADGDYHVAIHATTAAADSDVFFVLSIAVEETLSVAEFDSNTFKHFYNKDLETLTISSSNLPLTNIEVYSILGQAVINQPLSSDTETVDLSGLNDGVYLAKVNVEGGSKTIKFVKQ